MQMIHLLKGFVQPRSSLVDRCIGMPWAVDFIRQVQFGIMVMADRSLFLFVPTYDVFFLGDARTDEFLIAGICTGKGGCPYGNVSAVVVKQYNRVLCTANSLSHARWSRRTQPQAATQR